MTVIDFKLLESAPLGHDPYKYVLVPGLITKAALDGANADFPEINLTKELSANGVVQITNIRKLVNRTPETKPRITAPA